MQQIVPDKGASQTDYRNVLRLYKRHILQEWSKILHEEDTNAYKI